MDGRTAQPALTGAARPLVGRREVLAAMRAALDASLRGRFQFLALSGEPGAGKTRLLGELAAMAAQRGGTALWGRAAEFEQMMPFSVLIDALDDYLDTRCSEIIDALGTTQASLLASVFPALAPAGRDGGAAGRLDADRSGLARYRLYRAVRHLVGASAGQSGLVLILDDVHWADDSSMEFLDHIVRHPATGPVLVAVAYRPAQAPPRLTTLTGLAGDSGHQVTVGPLSPEEVAAFLGPTVSRGRGRALYLASGGNPFYLEALARMGDMAVAQLPPTVLAALQVELGNLPAVALLVAQAAAVTADEFEPALAAVTAEMPLDSALAAIDVLVDRDIVRPSATAGRFRFRHPLVRRAAYESAAPGWRLGAHARIAAHLARLGAPALARAHHVAQSGAFGDREAIDVLVTAAHAVIAHAPATSAHWLQAALRLMPDDPAAREDRMALLMELSWAQGVSGRLAEGRDTARELLRLLPDDDVTRRGRAARVCALMERQLDRPHEARALLLDELSRMTNPRSAAAVPLRMRLVAESMLRVDFRAAQAVLDLMPDTAAGWEPGLAVAVAALRPMPAYAAGRPAEALRYAAAADRLLEAAPDEHLSEWLDAIAWLCWAETYMGRSRDALRHFDRAAAIARSTGQSYILTNLLAGRAQTLLAMGRLADATAAAEESVEGARLLDSGQQLVFALTQACLAASWSGDDEAAICAGDEAVRCGVGGGEVWEASARYARGQALINAGRLAEGVEALVDACDRFATPRFDRGTLLRACETLAWAAAARGSEQEALDWAARASRLDDPHVPAFSGLVPLAHAHGLRRTEPARAAAAAEQAARLLADSDRHLDAGRARLTAGFAWRQAADRQRARDAFRAAAVILDSCGARNLTALAHRELRRLGVRAAGPTSPTSPASGTDSAALGLSPGSWKWPGWWRTG